jgi:hypothetical protein
MPNPIVRNYPGTANIPVYGAGWGTLYSDGPTSDTLQNVKMTLYNGVFCEAVSPSSKYRK